MKKRLPFFTGRGYGRGKSVEVWISPQTERILLADREETDKAVQCSRERGEHFCISIFVPEVALSTRNLGTKSILVLELKPRIAKDEEDRDKGGKAEEDDYERSAPEIDEAENMRE